MSLSKTLFSFNVEYNVYGGGKHVSANTDMAVKYSYEK